MKIKPTLLFVLSLAATVVYSNNNEDCATTHSLFVEAAKVESYDTAYPYLQELLKNCASYHITTFQYGERLFRNKLEKAPQAEKQAVFSEYTAFYNQRFQNFPTNTPEGKMLADLAQAQFDYGLGTKMSQYRAFETAYNKDKAGFTSPKSIYTYFSLAVDLFQENQLPIADIFGLYDEIIAKVQFEENDLAGKITPLIEKQDRRENLTDTEARLLKAGETNLNSYSIITNNINAKLGSIADCDNLILLYSKDFENNKTDEDWLKSVAKRLSDKECSDPFAFQIAEALHAIQPSPESAVTLGLRAEKEGNINTALEYFNQAADLYTDSNRKANVLYRIADIYRKRGSLSNARTYYRRAIDARPSFGNAYLQLATMYANSSNDCGNTIFEKRAINWLAADLARTAARVDPSIAKAANAHVESYVQRAPSKQDVFLEGMEGQTVTFSCWVGGSVKVPNL